MRYVALLMMVLPLLLTGCGFQMRGDWQLPPSARTTFLSGGSQPLYTYLQREFRSASAELVREDGAADTATLGILQELMESRVLSVDNRGKVIENEISYILTFKFTAADGKVLIADQQIIMVRDYPFGATDVLGSAQEEQLLRDDMYKDMARQIMRRIQAQAK